MYEKVNENIVSITKNDVSIQLSMHELKEAIKILEGQPKKESDFITIYSDASYYNITKEAKLGYSGKCCHGIIEKSISISDVGNIQVAEMLAIEAAVMEALEKFPQLTGFFINSDNLCCVHELWSFKETKPSSITPIKDRILEKIGNRWIRAKHVKAHTGKGDVRSYMNRKADKLTRVKHQQVQ